MPRAEGPGAAAGILFCVLLAAEPVRAQAPEALDGIAGALLERGFENVAVDVQDSTVTVWYENRIFRNEMTAMGVAAHLAASHLESPAILELIPQNRGVAVVAVAAPAPAWRRFLEGTLDVGGFRSELRIDPTRRRSGLPLAPRGIERRNRPYLKTDLQVRPLLDFRLGDGADPFDYALRLAPEAVMSPLPGSLVTLQAAIRIHDDIRTFDCIDDEGNPTTCGPPWIEPERNTLSWGGWLPADCLLAVSGGLFPGDRWGVAGEVGRLFWAGQLELRVGGDVSGLFELIEDVLNYSSLDEWSLFGAATHRFRGLDIETTLIAGRFREEDFAVKFELARRIREFEIGFFVATNEVDFNTSPYAGEDEGATSAGVNLRFALPVRRYARPATFRPSTVPEFPFTYQSTAERVGEQVSLYDNLDRLRKRLYPTFIWNEIDDLRSAVRYLREGDEP